MSEHNQIHIHAKETEDIGATWLRGSPPPKAREPRSGYQLVMVDHRLVVRLDEG